MALFIWTEFWKRESQSFFKIMRMSTSVFANRFQARFNYTDCKILDFGCGPGFLVELLAKQKCQITGLDINESYIRICQQHFPYHSFSVIDTDLESLQTSLNEQTKILSYDFVILLSVSQYYPSHKEFESTIITLSSYLKKGGTLIVADVISKDTSAWKDLLAVFRQSIRSGNVFNLIGFVLHLLFSNYHKVSKQAPLLTFEDESLKNLANSLSLSYQKFEGMTLHPTRNTYAFSVPLESR